MRLLRQQREVPHRTFGCEPCGVIFYSEGSQSELADVNASAVGSCLMQCVSTLGVSQDKLFGA